MADRATAEAAGPGVESKRRVAVDILRRTNGVVVAFSGGADSAFLAALAREALGERAVAVTALSPTYPEREQRAAAETARAIGIRHEIVASNELEIAGFSDNPPDRCYHCKKALFTALIETAKRLGLPAVADGSNADDPRDHRPGRRAARECGVVSPLLEAGLTKADIRELSRRMALRTADKPALACLASRFPYGTKITAERLAAVDRLEAEILALGFGQVRARWHGDVARVEVPPEDIARACEPDARSRIAAAARAAGFLYAALDLDGYRTGSLNEALRPAGGRGRPDPSGG